MAHIEPVDPLQSRGTTKVLLDGVQKQRGFVPALMRLLAHSPAVFDGYLYSGHALENGILSAQLRERIAIAVSEANGCPCCVASHRQFGRDAGLSERELDAACDATSDDPAAAAALNFARVLMETGGHVSVSQFATVHAAGFGSTAIIEITAVVARAMFANFINNLGSSPDF
jgi:uncharacterized peroxidase-related enzyme